MTDPVTQEYLTRRTLEIAEEELHKKIIEDTPALAAEARHLAEVLRESVAFEREKLGLSLANVTLDLAEVSSKKFSGDADFVGQLPLSKGVLLVSGKLELNTEGCKVLRLHFVPDLSGEL